MGPGGGGGGGLAKRQKFNPECECQCEPHIGARGGSSGGMREKACATFSQDSKLDATKFALPRRCCFTQLTMGETFSNDFGITNGRHVGGRGLVGTS